MERSGFRLRPFPAGARLAPLALAGLALLAAMAVATGVGTVEVGPRGVMGAVWRGLRGVPAGTADTIVWQIRLPRVVMAALVGGALSLSGAAFQGVFRNPLADPFLLGVASGAAFGAALSIGFGAAMPLLGAMGLPASAFGAALLAVGLVVFLARQGSRLPILHLILAGAVLGSCFSAATSLVMLAAREQAAGILAWLLGSFALSSWPEVMSVFPPVLAAGMTVWLSGRSLNLLQLGDEQAQQLGVPVGRVRLLLVVAATLATAAAVSVSGTIGFVGLLVPHAVRLTVGPDNRTLVPMAAVVGALFMVLADLLARTLIAPAEIPIGVITALVGGPFFLYLLRRQRRTS